MKCPWCGSPVMIHGNRWECGFCGDFGDLALGEQEDTEISRYAEISLCFLNFQELDFSEAWEELKNRLREITEENWDMLLSSLRGVFWYTVTQAIRNTSFDVGDERIRCLRDTIAPNHELWKFTDAAEVEQGIAGRKVIGFAQGNLTEQQCGSFWNQLIRTMPESWEPDQVCVIFKSLSTIYDYLLGEEAENGGYDIIEMKEAFERNWERYRYFHPNTAECIKRLGQDDDSQFDADCRSILMPYYETRLAEYGPDSEEDFFLGDFLRDVYGEDPGEARKMRQILTEAISGSKSQCPVVKERLEGACPFGE